jgi:hypothetical protein
MEIHDNARVEPALHGDIAQYSPPSTGTSLRMA